ncbi:hypothetical protein N752_28165 [Desulforamulus aquiferis]|nr:hypothetical protein N752_28165 [Desulforamulus aquiferis]
MGQMGYIKLTAETGKLLADIGAWIFFGLVLLFAGWILIAFLRGIPVLRGEAEGSAGGKGVSH